MGNVIEKPFGNVRLQIVKLISSLLSMHNQQINERFAQLNTIKVILVSMFYCIKDFLILILFLYIFYCIICNFSNYTFIYMKKIY